MSEKIQDEELPLPSYLRVYKNTFLLKYTVTYMPEYEKLKCRDDDVYVMSYPKCGTTWMQAIVWLVMNDADVAFQGGSKELDELFLLLEWPFNNKNMAEFGKLKKLPECPDWEARPSPRLFKTHMNFQLLPTQIVKRTKTPKIVYVSRNPKDTAVSFYHFTKGFDLSPMGMHNDFANSTFPEFYKYYMQGKCNYGEYWQHQVDFWKHRHWENILFVKYEDMKKDLKGEVRRVTNFLGKNLSEEKIDKIVEATTFSSMKRNNTVNNTAMKASRTQDATPFMRKGAPR
ncbi:PREDICTED: sulfotransferase 1C4-like [Priapulus caudatus]|uniref:Sulfotransferase 1C4-like n=1 Tax=Priapulus caudatus TaxID=37621 RepID=A0ABM1F3P3_PRICU|nr:PREDICTED: sulfotransferase 1C4-like [Priapulus caudatus]